MLKVHNLYRNYQQGRSSIEVLKNLNMEIPTGVSAAIVGPSGSGKSTLLSILAGLELPDRGEVSVGEFSYSGKSLEDLIEVRKGRVSIVFQQFFLMPHLTVKENVALPLEIRGEANIEQKVLTQLEKVGLSHRLNHLPSELSGGESQRAAIARALVGRPQVLLADEPTGNLDEDTAAKVSNLLFDLCRDHETTLILVTHNRELAERCQYRYKLNLGQVHAF